MDNKRYKVLLIEDDSIDQMAFKQMIENENLPYDYTIAETVSQACSTLKSESFDVVVADYLLGDGTAFDIFGSIKDTPTVVTTGAGDEQIAVKAMKAGACDYLIKDPQRNYLKILPLVIDSAISNRKIADELKRTHTQNEQLLGAISSILIALDSDYRIIHWNQLAEQTFAISAENVIGKPFFDCGIRWDWTRIAGWITDYHREQSCSTLENVRYINPDDKPGCLTIRVSPFTTELSPQQPGFLLLADDTTKRKFLENQLSETRKLRAIGQLVDGIIQEISTPVKQIADNTHFLQQCFEQIYKMLEKHQAPPKTNGDLETLPESAEQITAPTEQPDTEHLHSRLCSAIEQSLNDIRQITGIIQILKEFTHPHTYRKKAVDINKAIERIITLSCSNWKYTAEIKTDFEPELPPVSCFPDAIDQVILNLLINATEAIAKRLAGKPEHKGTITIKTCQYANWVQIHITDTGTGIPEEIAEKIFEPFFTTKELGKGTGQGLTICRDQVDKLGGMLTFDSTLEKGTTFTVHLRCESEPAEANTSQARAYS